MKAHDTAGENCRPWSVEKKSRTRQEKRRIKKGCVSLAALAFPLKQTGRGTRIRTLDLRIKSPLLYQLSYTPDTGTAISRGCPAKGDAYYTGDTTRFVARCDVPTRGERSAGIFDSRAQ